MPEIEYILDTCTLSHFLEGRKEVVDYVKNLPVDSTFITPITIAEAYYGILSAPNSRLEEVEDMKEAIHSFPCLSIDRTVAYIHAQIKAKSHNTGCKNDRDIWMVAYCEMYEATLVTTDKRLQYLSKFGGKIEIIPI